MMVYDGAGLVLSRGTCQVAKDGRTVMFTSVADPEALFQYYFGRRGRRVTVELEHVTKTGWLKTRWDGTGRTWFLGGRGVMTFDPRGEGQPRVVR